MSVVTVFYNVDSQPAKESIQRELRWYDTIKKEMQVFKGGKLGFEYKKDDYLVKMGEQERKKRGINSEYRLLPKVEDLLITNYNKTNKTTNKKEVEKWFNNYLNYNNSEVIIITSNNAEVEFEVSKKEKDDFTYQLERAGFRYG